MTSRAASSGGALHGCVEARLQPVQAPQSFLDALPGLAEVFAGAASGEVLLVLALAIHRLLYGLQLRLKRDEVFEGLGYVAG